MSHLRTLPNIGPQLELQLIDAGIECPEQLALAGSREAWLRIRLRDPSACFNRLCALEGALQGVRWHYLPQDTKEQLRTFYHANKA